jgi:hypothetical protein
VHVVISSEFYCTHDALCILGRNLGTLPQTQNNSQENWGNLPQTIHPQITIGCHREAPDLISYGACIHSQVWSYGTSISDSISSTWYLCFDLNSEKGGGFRARCTKLDIAPLALACVRQPKWGCGRS